MQESVELNANSWRAGRWYLLLQILPAEQALLAILLHVGVVTLDKQLRQFGLLHGLLRGGEEAGKTNHMYMNLHASSIHKYATRDMEACGVSSTYCAGRSIWACGCT